MNQYCSDCSQECFIKNFAMQTSSLSAPGEWELERIKEFVENSSVPLSVDWYSTWREEITKNYVAIDVVRETNIIENNTQSVSIGIVDLLSNIGGQTGLWIGVSFLSIMEIIEMVYRIIQHEYYVIQRKLRTVSK